MAFLPVLCQPEALGLLGLFGSWRQTQTAEDQVDFSELWILFLFVSILALYVLARQRTDTQRQTGWQLVRSIELLSTNVCRDRFGLFLCGEGQLISPFSTRSGADPNRSRLHQFPDPFLLGHVCFYLSDSSASGITSRCKLMAGGLLRWTTRLHKHTSSRLRSCAQSLTNLRLHVSPPGRGNIPATCGLGLLFLKFLHDVRCSNFVFLPHALGAASSRSPQHLRILACSWLMAATKPLGGWQMPPFLIVPTHEPLPLTHSEGQRI